MQQNGIKGLEKKVNELTVCLKCTLTFNILPLEKKKQRLLGSCIGQFMPWYNSSCPCRDHR